METYTWQNVAMGGGGFVTGIITSKPEKDLMCARVDVGGALSRESGELLVGEQWQQ